MTGFSKFLCKIIQNILDHPKEDKYRSLKCSNDKVQLHIVRPVGAMVIMRVHCCPHATALLLFSFGFVRCQAIDFEEENVGTKDERLMMRMADTKKLKKELKRFKQLAKEPAPSSTTVAKRFKQMNKKLKIEVSCFNFSLCFYFSLVILL